LEVALRGLRALLAATLLLLLAIGAVHLVREALRDKTPNQAHARRLGLEEHWYLVAPLDADQEQDPLEKQLVELLARSKQALEIPVAREAVLDATRDGRVTPEELTHLEALLARAGALAQEYPELARSTGSNHTLFHAALSLHESQPQLLKQLYRSILAAKHKEAPLAQAIALLLELGYTKNVKVLNPHTGTFEEKTPSPLLAQVVANYTLALAEGLPRHSNQDLWLLGNATMINPEIYDFKPVTVKDMNGTLHEIGSKNIPRDTWMLVEHLKRTPYVIKYPELYLPFTIKVQQNAWDVFENPALNYWIKKEGRHVYIEEKYKPTDEIIWEKVIIPQWNYYWESFPQSGNISKRIIVFPVYNSTLLKQLIPNENDLKIALMIFWGFSDLTCDGVADLNADWNDLLRGKGFHRGLDAIAYTIQVLPEVYNRAISLYPNETVPFSKYNPKPMDIRFGYYSWIYDRGWHGLRNMFKQFIGFYPAEWRDIVDRIPLTEFHKYVVQNYDGINTYLFKNFEKYDIIAFVIGYNTRFFGIELGQDYFWEYALKAFGIPSLYNSAWSEYYINAPARYAGGYDTCIFGLPENVLKPLREGEYGKVLILPGNGICPVGSAIEGIEKDIEYGNKYPVYPNLKYAEIALPLRGYRIYFFKIGNEG
jgi:hypothetical protein